MVFQACRARRVNSTVAERNSSIESIGVGVADPGVGHAARRDDPQVESVPVGAGAGGRGGVGISAERLRHRDQGVGVVGVEVSDRPVGRGDTGSGSATA